MQVGLFQVQREMYFSRRMNVSGLCILKRLMNMKVCPLKYISKMSEMCFAEKKKKKNPECALLHLNGKKSKHKVNGIPKCLFYRQ